MDRTIQFTVEGEPRPQPRPRFNRETGRTYKGEHKSTKSVVGWKHAVALRGVEAMRKARLAPLEGPVWFQVVFRMPRPKSHHVAGDPRRPLKESAPHWHVCRPDRDNLTKAVMDALNGVAWVDDSQVVAGGVLKHYSSSPDRVGATICFNRLGEARSGKEAGVKPRASA